MVKTETCSHDYHIHQGHDTSSDTSLAKVGDKIVFVAEFTGNTQGFFIWGTRSIREDLDGFKIGLQILWNYPLKR